MATALRALFVEDSEADVYLMLRTLRKAGYEPVYERVETKEAMLEALQRQPWDVILADYSMPYFSAPAALKLLQESGLDLPFIIVSGTIGEETAVSAMRSGAHDYLLKGNLARLPVAVEREIRAASVREARRRVEADMHTVNRTLRLLSLVNQALMREGSEMALYRLVCQFSVEVGGYAAAWVGVVENSGMEVRPVCASGQGGDYLLSRHVSLAESDRDCDFSGTAIRTGKSIVIRDLAPAPAETPGSPEALAHGYRALIALPFRVDDRTAGALTLLGSVPCKFPPEEVKLLEEMAGDLAFGIRSLRVRQDRERTEESLRERVEELDKIMKIAPVAIWIGHDPECKHITGNDTANSLYEVRSDGRKASDDKAARYFLEAGRELPEEDLPMQRAARRNQEVCDEEVQVVLSGGKRLTLLGNARPLRNPDGTVRGCVGTFLDVTRRKREEELLREYAEQLLRMNADLDQFAYVAAHDLQEPLRTISGYLELLRLRYADRLEPQALALVQLAVESAQLMHGLILALLEYSHVGSQPVNLLPVDMEKVLAEALALHLKRMEETQASVTHDPLPEIAGDEMQLRKLLANLSAGRPISERTAGADGGVRHSARRRGPGRSPVAGHCRGESPAERLEVHRPDTARGD